MDMDGPAWTCMDMDGHGVTWIDMDGHGRKWMDVGVASPIRAGSSLPEKSRKKVPESEKWSRMTLDGNHDGYVGGLDGKHTFELHSIPLTHLDLAPPQVHGIVRQFCGRYIFTS